MNEINTYPEISLQDVIASDATIKLVNEADRVLSVLGFTEHGQKHSAIVSARAKMVLINLGYKDRRAELAAIAGYIHDIGNVVNRNLHELVGATMAFSLLRELNMDPAEIGPVISAIGNHDEQSGEPVNAISAALTLADKSDVRRDRVRNPSMVSFDIHDRVNYAVTDNRLDVESKSKTVTLSLHIDTEISRVMDYFEIFMGRMIMCRKSARHLGCNFTLNINDVEMS